MADPGYKILLFTSLAFVAGCLAGRFFLRKGLGGTTQKNSDFEKEKRDALIAERQNLYNMLDGLPMAFHLQGSDYSVPFANKVFRERFGEPARKMCYDLMHNRESPCEVCSTFKVFEKGENISTVWTAQDGRTYLTVCTPFKDIGGEDLVMEMALDITDLEQAKKDAIEARELAEEASKAKAEFLAQVSHEFRTPLNAILGFGQLLQMGKADPASQSSWVSEIMLAGAHLLELINNILNYSSIDNSLTKINLEILEAAPLIKEAIEPFKSLAEKNEIALSEEIDSDELFIKVDPVWFKRSLSNLISNAIKFNRPGGSASVSLKSQNENVLIIVADSGKGIPEDKKDKVFEPFFRLEKDANFIPGVGIGLSAAKKNTEKMGGAISLESELEKGTRVTLSFPSRVPRNIPAI